MEDNFTKEYFKDKSEEYLKALDKRSKEYKAYKKLSKPKGLGDKVEELFTKTGIKSVVEFINNGECEGCKRRKQMLNKLFPEVVYNETKGKLTEQQKATLEHIGLDKDRYSSDEASILEGIYNQTNHTNIRICRQCQSSAKEWKAVVTRLQKMM